ncbi:hypothetical protein BKA65DRAFT_601844 [Rhexocercosporidium sp. MPI-PUGE-AT-0058]|nr:hypothetical protein BKA65DRAFT_601844 [Rhexocercosporidium sp. MPI-PUGE-AT-0058]
MKLDRRFGILLNCRTQIDKISKRICDTHHEVGLEEMEQVDELLAALHQFMEGQPVDDPLYPGGPPASVVERICGMYDNDASSEDESSDDEDLPPRAECNPTNCMTSIEIDKISPPQSNITNSDLEVAKSTANKREKVKQPKSKASVASRAKSGDENKPKEISGNTASSPSMATKKPISRKKASLNAVKWPVYPSAHGQPRFINIRYLDLVEGSEVMRDIFTLKALGGLEDKNDKTDCIIYDPKTPYVSKRYIRDLVIYLPTLVASKFAQGRKHYGAIQSLSSEELWAGLQCWAGWLKDGRIEVGTDKGARRGCLFTAAFLHTPDDYLMGVLERVPKQKLKRKRGEYEEC